MKINDLRLAPEHIPALAVWHHHEWAHLNPGGSVEKRIENMQDYLGDRLVPSLFVGTENGRLVGSAGILANDMDTKMELSPWLASVYVDPEFRRRGLGSTLVKHAMKKASDAGYSALHLFTPDQEHFYQALGWSTISKELYRGELVTVMRIDLPKKQGL